MASGTDMVLSDPGARNSSDAQHSLLSDWSRFLALQLPSQPASELTVCGREVPAIGALAAPTAWLIRPEGYVSAAGGAPRVGPTAAP